MLDRIVAICMLLSLILYALMGGADLGGGMWDLLAAGPRAPRQRQAIAAAMPYNTGKAHEVGRESAVAPPRGASTSSRKISRPARICSRQTRVL